VLTVIEDEAERADVDLAYRVARGDTPPALRDEKPRLGVE